MRLWLILAGAGLVTYLTRASFLLAGDRLPLPAVVQRGLRYVAPAAFAAIAAPGLLGGDRFANFEADVPRLIAAVVAGVVIARTRSVPISLLVGLVTLWVLLLAT
jgi:branched-subunit amino acid transport protein